MFAPKKVKHVDLGALPKSSTSWIELELPGVSPQVALGPIAAIVRGASNGPTIYIGSGTHGDELNSIEAVRRAAQSLDPRRVHGTVIFVVSQNRSTFVNCCRLSPGDNKNLDHCFPGDRSGTPTDVIAAVLFEELVIHADYLLDLHCASQGGWNLLYAIVYAEDPHVRSGSEALAEAFGARIVLHAHKEAGKPLGDSFGSALDHNIFVQAAARGIPAAIVEFGGAREREDSQISLGVAGIFNVLATYRVIEDAPIPHRAEQAEQAIAIRTDTPGFLRIVTPSGTHVRKGEIIAWIETLAGERHEVHAPQAGRIIRMTTTGSIARNERVVTMSVD
jgi:predicted deacylase